MLIKLGFQELYSRILDGLIATSRISEFFKKLKINLDFESESSDRMKRFSDVSK